MDENYGAQLIPNYWKRYQTISIILAVVIVILGIVIFLAHRRYPEGKNLLIIKIILIIYDFVFDITFLLTSADDIGGLFTFSLLSVVIPIIFNMIMALYSLIQEIMHNKKFNQWCKENGLVISVITVISCADVEALDILSSKIAGLRIFSAPSLSEKIMNLIFWTGCINIFMEDIPQFVIQVYYQRNIIVFTIIPTLTLISSFITLCIGIIGRIYFIFIHFYHRESEINYSKSSQDENSNDITFEI